MKGSFYYWPAYTNPHDTGNGVLPTYYSTTSETPPGIAARNKLITVANQLIARGDRKLADDILKALALFADAGL